MYKGDSFLGAKVQRLSDENTWSFFGGTDLSDRLALQGTFGDGGVRGVVQTRFGESYLIGGFGLNDRQKWDANVHYSDAHNFGFAKWSQQSIDLKWVHGNINPKIATFAGSVTDSGNNELDDTFTDPFLPFSIGKESAVKHDFFAPNTAFLGKPKGSVSFEGRLKEDDRAYANIGYRVGDLGSFTRISILGGAYARLEDNFSLQNSGVEARAALGVGLGPLDFYVTQAWGKNKPQTSLVVSLHTDF